MFFSSMAFMQRRWVPHHVLDTLLKAVFKFILALVYFGLGWLILTWLSDGGETSAWDKFADGTRRQRNDGTVVVLFSAVLLFLPYYAVIAGVFSVILSAVRGTTPFENKALKKRFVLEYEKEFQYSLARRVDMREEFLGRKNWIAAGCPQGGDDFPG